MVAKFRGPDAIHITRLNADGTGKAGGDIDKLIFGKPSGAPIVIQEVRKAPVVICEGIEDGLSIALAMPEWSVWAAGSAGQIPHLAGMTGDERPILAFDLDKAGLNAYRKCQTLLGKRLATIRFPKHRDANILLRVYGVGVLREFIRG